MALLSAVVHATYPPSLSYCLMPAAPMLTPSEMRLCALIGQNQNTPSDRKTRALKQVARLDRISKALWACVLPSLSTVTGMEPVISASGFGSSSLLYSSVSFK